MTYVHQCDSSSSLTLIHLVSSTVFHLVWMIGFTLKSPCNHPFNPLLTPVTHKIHRLCTYYPFKLPLASPMSPSYISSHQRVLKSDLYLLWNFPRGTLTLEPPSLQPFSLSDPDVMVECFARVRNHEFEGIWFTQYYLRCSNVRNMVAEKAALNVSV